MRARCDPFGFDSSGSQQLPASRVLDRMPTGGGAPLRFADRAYGVDFSACAETGNQSDASISACRGDNDDLVPGARRFASCRGFDLACDLLQTIYRSSVWQYHGDACRRKNDHRERRCGCPDCGGDRTLAGLHIRSRALARVAEAKAQSANEQVSRLRTTLDNQQLADAIAAEAHDTLAHSLSLLALNASALQAESRKLKAEAEQLGNANVAGMAGKIAGTTEDIRRQASGALDEAHSVIDMLRHPEDARLQLAANDAEASLTRDSLLQLAANDAEASLTRDSLLQLIGDARAANMRIDTWIDVQQLGQLDESIGVIAYHVVQEGLTNVRRHAPGAPVSLQVDANPPQGVHVHVSNPTTPQSPSHMADTRKGAGLPGLAKRIQQAGGTCQYGFDQHNVFHLDVRLPWVG